MDAGIVGDDRLQLMLVVLVVGHLSGFLLPAWMSKGQAKVGEIGEESGWMQQDGEVGEEVA